MVTTRRRSSRLHNRTPKRQTLTFAALENIAEREHTPVKEQQNVAIPASAPPKISGLPRPTQWSTPSSHNLLKPDFDEMHPSHAHTTAKKLTFTQRVPLAPAHDYDETPSKHIPGSFPADEIEHAIPFTSPTFEFKFKRPSYDLSDEARKLMEEVRQNAAQYKDKLASLKETEENEHGGRKIASARGRMGRFSDVHLNEFRKMNSIADHPSSFRADPSRIATPTSALKRTNSKAGLDKAESPFVRPTSAKKSIPIPQDTDTDRIESAAKRFKAQSGQSIARAAPNAEQPKIGTPNVERIKSNIPAPSSVTTPTKASLARSNSVKSLTAGPSKIPSLGLPMTTSVPAFSTPQPARVTPAGQYTASKARTSFAHKLKEVRSILRRPQIRFSDDPVKIAAGTHVATPKSQIGKPLPAVPEDTPGTPSNRAEKHVNFSPKPDAVFCIPAHFLSPAQPPTPSPAKPFTGLDGQMAATAYPTLPQASPSITKATGPMDFTFRADKQISFAQTPKMASPSIRKVRASDASALKPSNGLASPSPTKLFSTPARFSDFPVVPLGDVPHGLSNKKRKRESADVGDKGEDGDKENKADPSVLATDAEPREESPKKKARTMPTTEAARKPNVVAKSGPFGKPTAASKLNSGAGKLHMPSAAVRSGGANGQKKSFLSLSRLNALARPKHRG